jgi:AAA+ ATPase superfamily predicted ATPase
MAGFIGREKELAALREAFNGKKSQFIPIYGRRRVGKSELILQFIRNQPALYFLGKQAPSMLNIKEFISSAMKHTESPELLQTTALDWKSVLLSFSQGLPCERKTILVFDEFQWIAQSSPELPSVLQEMWDMHWKKTGRMFLIICGSYMGFMEREVLGRKSPLFGRRTAQILLKPFSYLEAARFHPKLSDIEKAEIYFICGGIPFYLEFFNPHNSVEMNIIANFLTEYSALFREVEFLLREELRELEKYHGILTALAAGRCSPRVISERSGIDEKMLNYYLNQLSELGYIAKHYPLTSAPYSKAAVRYALEDPLLRFWFRFIYPNIGAIALREPDKGYGDFIKPYLDSYFGICFERLCREALPMIYLQEKVNASFSIGEYWDSTTQIDVVGLRRDNRLDIAECRWGVVRSLSSLCKELDGKIKAYPNTDRLTINRRLFLRKAPTGKSSKLLYKMHTLHDLYLL